MLIQLGHGDGIAELTTSPPKGIFHSLPAYQLPLCCPSSHNTTHIPQGACAKASRCGTQALSNVGRYRHYMSAKRDMVYLLLTIPGIDHCVVVDHLQ